MNDQVTITVARRIVLRGYRIWRESNVEVKGREYVRLCDSISQEEFLRLCVMGVIEEGYITKLYPLPRIIIRPRVGPCKDHEESMMTRRVLLILGWTFHGYAY